MEDNYNSSDIAAVLAQLEALNQGINAENEKVDKLVEYLIVKDQQEQEEKERLQNEQLKKEEAEKELADSEQINADLEKEQQETRQEETIETYTELLTSINDGVQLTNQLLAVDVLIFGIVIGLLLIKIFIDRMIK